MKYKVSMDNKGKVTVDKELGKSLTEKCMGEGKAELLDSLVKKASEEIKYVFEVGDKVEGLPKPRNLEMAKKREFPDWRKKEMFFQHLNNVMATKLVKPSIIIEYVNQYQRGDK